MVLLLVLVLVGLMGNASLLGVVSFGACVGLVGKFLRILFSSISTHP